MPISYSRHQFPPLVIQHAIWLYVRFTLSYRDVEELLAQRGLEVSYETIRRWVLKFGPTIGPRSRTSQCDNENATCSASNRRGRPSASCPSMPPSTIRSTCSAT